MEIYILRHGIAEVGRFGMSDADRALVPEGKQKLRQVLRVARASGVEPTLILTSPYKRAVETAEIAAEELAYSSEIVRCDALRPGCSPEEVWDDLRAYGSENRIALSGHEPLLGYLTGFLLGTPSLLIDLKKGSLVRIDMDHVGPQPRGVLRWYLTPRLAISRL
jgi:phosphohistidine phosphatase